MRDKTVFWAWGGVVLMIIAVLVAVATASAAPAARGGHATAPKTKKTPPITGGVSYYLPPSSV